MRRALDELVIEGIQTTIPLHRRIFRNPDFLEGRVDTTWVERVLMPRQVNGIWRTSSFQRQVQPTFIRRRGLCENQRQGIDHGSGIMALAVASRSD